VVFGKVAETPRVDAGIDIHRDRAQGSEHEHENNQFDTDAIVSVTACRLSEMTRLLTDPRMRYQSPNAGQKQADDQVVPS
jgi:hypothetical protein